MSDKVIDFKKNENENCRRKTNLSSTYRDDNDFHVWFNITNAQPNVHMPYENKNDKS